MEFGWAPEDVAFRDLLRAFLDDELPDHWFGRTAILGSHENTEYSRRFARLLADRNWLIPHWPDEYGGGRPERMHSRLFAKTMAALGLADQENAYLSLIPGPTLATVNLMSAIGLRRSRRVILRRRGDIERGAPGA